MREAAIENGQFPLAIGTSLAIEGLLGIHPAQTEAGAKPKPNLQLIRSIDSIWINLATLVRNAWAAVSKDVIDTMTPQVVCGKLKSEIEELPSIVSNGLKREVKIVVYYEEPSHIQRNFPHALFIKPNTDKQLKRFSSEQRTIRLLLELNDSRSLTPVVILKQPLNNVRNLSIALITHYSKDLLWKESFERLYLLESHTGVLKPPLLWYTKLRGITAGDRLPFNPVTLQIFGDGNLFAAMSLKLRNELKQLAKIKKWNGGTTFHSFSSGIMSSGSEELKAVYYKLRSA